MQGKNQIKPGLNLSVNFLTLLSYPLYPEPGYFKVRVGDFRTKTEATKIISDNQ